MFDVLSSKSSYGSVDWGVMDILIWAKGLVTFFPTGFLFEWVYFGEWQLSPCELPQGRGRGRGRDELSSHSQER